MKETQLLRRVLRPAEILMDSGQVRWS
jgi:hypothetical protein